MTRAPILIVLQLAICAVSFYYIAVFGTGAREDPWPIVFPMVFGSIWVYLTTLLVRGSRRKTLLLSLAMVEFPFAFCWPAWALAYVVLPYGTR